MTRGCRQSRKVTLCGLAELVTNVGESFIIWFWQNALADGFALTEGQFDDPLNRWIFYLDADPECDQLVGPDFAELQRVFSGSSH